MEPVMAVHTVTKASKDVAASIVESASDASDYRPPPPSKSIIKQPSYSTIQIECKLADFGVGTKTNLEGFVEIRLTKCTN